MVRLNQDGRRTIDTFFIIVLLALFSITSILVIVIGAKQYHAIADRMTENYETRTAASYLVEKFRQYDSADSVSITEIEGVSAISFTQVVNGQTYHTLIYAYGGYLREITISPDSSITPDAGQKIIEIKRLAMEERANNLYYFTLTDTYGNTTPIYISLNAD